MLEGKFYPSKCEGVTTMYYRIRKSRSMDFKITLKNVRINAKAWDANRQKFKPTFSTEYKDVAIKLNDFDKSVFELSNSLQLKGEKLNLSLLRTHYEKFFNLISTTEISEHTSFTEYYNYYIDSNKRVDGQSINGKNLGTNSLKGYKTMINNWNLFINHRNVKLNQIDFKLFSEFVKFQETKCKLGPNSIVTNINKFKAVLNYAYLNSINPHDDFVKGKFKYGEIESKEVYLTSIELKNLINLDLVKFSTLDIARDWFVIQCHTALRVSDLFTLNMKDFNDGFITKRTIKTQKEVCIPVLSEVENIIKKYNGLPNSLSQPIYNKKIKEVCELAGITDTVNGARYEFIGNEKKLKRKVKGKYPKFKLISSHTARRTFITLLSNNPNITNYEIMAVSGHSNTKTLEKYVRSSNAERAMSLKSKLLNEKLT